MRRTSVLVASLLAFAAAGCAPAVTTAAPESPPEPATVQAHTAPRELSPDGTSWSVYIAVGIGDHVAKVCSGSLISRRVVLTAAHCLEHNDGSYARPSDISTVVGAGDTAGRPAVGREVVGIDVHPQRNYRYLDRDVVASGYDVALLTLAAPVNSSPLPLAVDPEAVAPGPIVTYGYGYIPAQTPMNADGTRSGLVTVSPADKLGIVACNDRDVSPDHLCMGSADPTVWGTAPGDSGGPWIRQSRGGSEVQVAVTSYGTVDLPGDSVGTNVLDVLPWIRARAGLLQVAAGSIVRDPASGSAWRVHPDGYRRLVPTAAAFDCLTQAGMPVVDDDIFTIEQIPEAVGAVERCTVLGNSATPASTTTPAPLAAITTAPVASAPTTTPPSTTTSPAPPPTLPAPAAAQVSPTTEPIRVLVASASLTAARSPVGSDLAITGNDSRRLALGAGLLFAVGLTLVVVQLRIRRVPS